MKMRTGIAAICAVLSVVLLATENSSADTFEYILARPETEASTHVVSTADGGFIISGIRYPGTHPNYQAVLVRLDAAGDTVWARMWGDATFHRLFHSVAAMADGGFMGVGQRALVTPARTYIVRTDAYGDTLWTRAYGDTIDIATRNMRRLNDGSLAIIGSELDEGYDAVFLLRIDEAGDTLSINKYDYGEGYAVRDIVQLQSGYHIIVGRHDVGGGLANGFVMCLDPSRNFLWQETVPNDNYLWLDGVCAANDSMAMANGTINIIPWSGSPPEPIDRNPLKPYFSTIGGFGTGYKAPSLPAAPAAGEDDGVIALIDASPSGGVVFTSMLRTPGDEGLNSIAEYDDDLILSVGLTDYYADNAGEYEGWVLLHDSWGDTLKTWRYAPGVVNAFWSAEKVSDGGFITVGNTSPDGTQYDIFAEKDDVPDMTWFMPSVKSGPGPLSVSFKDLSTFEATGWQWDFDGDGVTDDYTQDPEYIFNDPGSHSVTLIATNGSVTDTLTRQDLILVSCPVLYATPSPLARPCSRGVTKCEVGDMCGGTISFDYYEDEDWFDVRKSFFFDDFDSGSIDPLWDVALGDWTVTPEGKLTSDTYPDNIIMVDSVVTDFTLSVVIGPIIGREYIVRMRDNINGCITFNLHGNGGRAWFQYYNGIWSGFINIVYDVFLPGETHKFTVTAKGDRIEVFLDDETTPFTYYDNMDPNLDSGRVGLQCSYTPSELILFDDFSLTIDGDNSLYVRHDKNCGDSRSGTITITSTEAANSPIYLDVNQAGDCPCVGFSAAERSGPVPFVVQFNDESSGGPTSWQWDFENDGTDDSALQNPSHQYDVPGSYSVKLIAGFTTESDTLVRYDHITATNRDTVTICPVTVTSNTQFSVPVLCEGIDSLGVVSCYLDYDDTKLAFDGVVSHVPGEFFSAGVVGDHISVQWFDPTGGSDPIPADIDTLFSLLFSNIGAYEDSTQLGFEFSTYQTAIGEAAGNPIEYVEWRDAPPYGKITIGIQANVSGRVGYYHEDKNVPGADISLGPPNPDVVTDDLGEYVFAPYPVDDYTLNISKDDDTWGINSLDAIKVVRHSSGIEAFTDPDQVFAANVNLDSYVNAFDAIKIVRASVGLEPLASGDWCFEPDSVVFTPLAFDTVQDFKAIRMGDVNGDWDPPVGGMSPNMLASLEELSDNDMDVPLTIPGGALQTITISMPDTSIGAGIDTIHAPLEVTEFTGIGAVSFRISYCDTVLSYFGLTSNCSADFTSNLVGDEIRVEWFDATGGFQPLDIGTGLLLTLHFEVTGDEGDSSQLDFTPASMIGDSAGDPIDDVLFTDGSVTIATGTGTGDDGKLPDAYRLYPCYPNPFNPVTHIRFDIAVTEEGPRNVTLQIYDVRGREVRRLVDRKHEAGRHTIAWDGKNNSGNAVISGVYFYKLTIGDFSDTKKMILLR